MLTRIEKRLPQISTAFIISVILLLVLADILEGMTWGWFYESSAATPPGCTTMADGLVVCDAP